MHHTSKKHHIQAMDLIPKREIRILSLIRLSVALNSFPNLQILNNIQWLIFHFYLILRNPISNAWAAHIDNIVILNRAWLRQNHKGLWNSSQNDHHIAFIGMSVLRVLRQAMRPIAEEAHRIYSKWRTKSAMSWTILWIGCLTKYTETTSGI